VLEGAAIIREFQNLPARVLGEVCSYVSCLGSDPEGCLIQQCPVRANCENFTLPSV
jgi:hypothetical protein